MEWLERLNQSVGYIEDNLEGEIDYHHAAQIACCSFYHYQRMFSYIANVSLAEYVRRRRMTLAAFDLQHSDVKVIDVALKYGYDSPTAFARAFQQMHGVSPSSARNEGVKLKAHSRMTFFISIKGDTEMNYTIEKKSAFRIVGAKKHMKYNVDENFAAVPQFWGEVMQSGLFGLIAQMSNKEPYGVLGVSSSTNEEDLDYYIATATDQAVGEGMEDFEVPEATWAIFECIGPMPAAIQNLQKQVITDWLPTSGYEYANAPDIEVYPAGDPSAADYRSQVWLPVVKKG